MIEISINKDTEAFKRITRAGFSFDNFKYEIFETEAGYIRIETSCDVICICGKKEGDRLDEIIHDADKALYQAKTQGRNQVCIFN